MRKLICAILSVILLLGAAVTAWAEDTATLTITPDKTEVTANGSAVQVKFTVTVTPPEGRELGVFSFRLKPSGGMTLPGSFKENGEAVITYADFEKINGEIEDVDAQYKNPRNLCSGRSKS